MEFGKALISLVPLFSLRQHETIDFVLGWRSLERTLLIERKARLGCWATPCWPSHLQSTEIERNKLLPLKSIF